MLVSQNSRGEQRMQQVPRSNGLLSHHRALRAAGFSFAYPQKPWGEGWSWRWLLRSFRLFLSAWHSEVHMHCTECELHLDLYAIRVSRPCYSCDICLEEQRAVG
jgi:hypothetical protein